jgi:lipopolysaccharide transport system permease protein
MTAVNAGLQAAEDRRGLFKDLAELYQYRGLITTWTRREIKVRYKQSLLGAAWAILQPMALMLMFTLVFSMLARIPTDGIPYPVFSYAAVLPWTFFSTTISFGTTSLINNLNLVTKTYFPREILPIGILGASFVDYLIASTIFIGMLFYYQTPLTPAVLWLPVILLIQIMLMLGISFLASALSIHYRDVRFIVPLGLQLWFYATPIIYPFSLVPDRMKAVYALNPMVGVINSYRRIFLSGMAPDPSVLLASGVVGAVVLFIGYRVFKHLERTFADII